MQLFSAPTKSQVFVWGKHYNFFTITKLITEDYRLLVVLLGAGVGEAVSAAGC